MPGFTMNWGAVAAIVLMLILAAVAGPHGLEKQSRPLRPRGSPRGRSGPPQRGRLAGPGWADYYATLFGDVAARVRL
jgi:hypothetical protein